jgi:2,5-diketo-D-gluconate reductase A
VMRGRLAEEAALTAIAADHGRTPAQIVLRWIVQRGIVAIPKSVHPVRVRENADIWGFELDALTMARIAALDRGERLGPHPDKWLG